MAAIFALGIFNCIFLNESVIIAIKISPTFAHKGPINTCSNLIFVHVKYIDSKLLCHVQTIDLIGSVYFMTEHHIFYKI